MASRVESFFFDAIASLFNPGTPSNHPFKLAYHHHEREKRHQYEQHVHEVEHSHLIRFISFYYNRGVCDAVNQVYKRLHAYIASLLSENLIFLMGR